QPGGRGGGEREHEGAVRHPSALRTALHVLLVGVLRREVTGDPGEQADVGLGDRLAEDNCRADGGESVAPSGGTHEVTRSAKCPAPAPRAPVARSASSSSVRPSSAISSPVCSPSSGAGRRAGSCAPSSLI